MIEQLNFLYNSCNASISFTLTANKSQLQKLKQINYYHLLNKQTMTKELRNEQGESLASARISSKVENFFSFFFF
jgi:hypothetical protein